MAKKREPLGAANSKYCSTLRITIRSELALLSRQISGDFSTQANAMPEELAAALQKILRAEWNLPVELRLEKTEREIYIASGVFEMNTETQNRGFVKMEGALVGVSGSVKEAIEHARDNVLPRGGTDGLLKWLARSIGVPVVNEVEKGPEDRVAFTSILAAKKNGDLGKVAPESIVNSFADQTGLKFRLEKRDVLTLHVNIAE